MTEADGSAVVTGRDAGCAFDHVSGRTFHGRRGGVENAFSYGVDYVLIDPTARHHHICGCFPVTVPT